MNSEFENLIIQELSRRGVAWDVLRQQSSQIVVFGSWSILAQRRVSDLDILCVGSGTRQKEAKVDIVWQTTEQVASWKWLQSELASHINFYGKWLIGENDWGHHCVTTDTTLLAKRKLIVSRCESLCRVGGRFSKIYLAKHAVKLRRDLQRLSLLMQRLPVCPSPILDWKWQLQEGSLDDLKTMTRDMGLADEIPTSIWDLIEPFARVGDWRKG